MKRLPGIIGVLLLAGSLLMGCANTKFYSREELHNLHDVIGYVEGEQLEVQKVLEDSLPERLVEKMEQDMEFVDYMSTKDYDPDKPMLALTFDDGPNSETTNQILDILEENNAKATFFVLGEKLGENTAPTLKRMVSIGCQVGNHSMNHKDLAYLDADGIRDQIETNNEKIREITGMPCRVMRPPYGEVNDLVRETITQPMIMWEIDTLDWDHLDPDKTIKAIRDYACDGTIILMHDIHAPTVEACRKIIPELAKKYQLVTISEMAYMKGITLEGGKQYFYIRQDDEDE